MTPAAKKVAPAKSLSDLVDNKPVEEDVPPVVEENPAPDSDLDSDGPDEDDEPNEQVDPFYSPEVVALKSDKTPAELAAETPDETAARYGISTEMSEEDLDNPRVQVYRDTLVNQVPSGTHLHPDIAKDLKNRGIAEQHTDNAQVKRTIVDAYDFAPDADHNDKF